MPRWAARTAPSSRRRACRTLTRQICEERPGQLGISHLSQLFPTDAGGLDARSIARAPRPFFRLSQELYATAGANGTARSSALPQAQHAADPGRCRRAAQGRGFVKHCRPRRFLPPARHAERARSRPASPTQSGLDQARARSSSAATRTGSTGTPEFLHQRQDSTDQTLGLEARSSRSCGRRSGLKAACLARRRRCGSRRFRPPPRRRRPPRHAPAHHAAAAARDWSRSSSRRPRAASGWAIRRRR